MLTIHVTAETYPELVAETLKTLGLACEAIPITAAEALSRAARPAQPAAEVVLPQPEAKKPGRPRKTESVSPAPASAAPAPSAPQPVAQESSTTPMAPASTPEAPPSSGDVQQGDGAGAASSAPTLADLRAALSGVNEKHGMPAVVKMLADFGAERVSLVPEDKRTEFVAACNAKAAEAA